MYVVCRYRSEVFKDLSTVAVVTGIVKNILASSYASESIVSVGGSIFSMSTSIQTIVTLIR